MIIRILAEGQYSLKAKPDRTRYYGRFSLMPSAPEMKSNLHHTYKSGELIRTKGKKLADEELVESACVPDPEISLEEAGHLADYPAICAELRTTAENPCPKYDNSH